MSNHIPSESDATPAFIQKLQAVSAVDASHICSILHLLCGFRVHVPYELVRARMVSQLVFHPFPSQHMHVYKL